MLCSRIIDVLNYAEGDATLENAVSRSLGAVGKVRARYQSNKFVLPTTDLAQQD